MKFRLITIIGKEIPEATELFFEYLERIHAYTNIVHIALKSSALKQFDNQQREETAMIMRMLLPNEELILLDAKGKEFTSLQLAGWLQKQLNASRNIAFVIGGAYGFNESLKKKASEMISLSKMTFPHQLARIIFAEQLYRAFTILHNQKYHH